MPRALLLLIVWLYAGAAYAAPALCVGNWCVSQSAFALLLQDAQLREPELTAASFKSKLADVRLLANYARSQQFVVAGDVFGVGFTPQVKLAREKFSLFKLHFDKRFTDYAKVHLGQDGLNSFLLSPLHVGGVDIQAALKPDNRRTIGMTPAQLAAAKNIVLARFQFPNAKPQQFTLAGLYAEQNVQGRLALQQQGSELIRAATQSFIKQQYFYWWLAQHSGLTQADIMRVGEALADRQLSNAWLEQQGLVEVMHDHESQRLEAVAKQVSEQKIHAWYQAHKDNFRITNSVQAAHLACETKVACDAGRIALLKGEAVAHVIKQHGRKTQTSADLGELTRTGTDKRWLTSLAMLQQPGEFSRPVRAPDGHWEVVWVTSRNTGFLPPKSSSVRYQASRAIARAQLLDEHQQLMRKLRKKTKVTL